MADQIDEFLNVLFSVTDAPLTDADRTRLANVKASWVLLNRRLGRFFVDIIGPKPQLVAIRDELIAMGRDPIVIAVFTPAYVDVDGAQVRQLQLTQANKAAWLAVARDVVTYDPVTGLPLTITRPTEYMDIHRWAGWPEKAIP